MTKEELGQLSDLRKEIKELDAKVERLQEQRVGKVTDRVHASLLLYHQDNHRSGSEGEQEA